MRSSSLQILCDYLPTFGPLHARLIADNAELISPSGLIEVMGAMSESPERSAREVARIVRLMNEKRIEPWSGDYLERVRRVLTDVDLDILTRLFAEYPDLSTLFGMREENIWRAGHGGEGSVR